jgi:hypothetical protein
MGSHPGDGGVVSARDRVEALAVYVSQDIPEAGGSSLDVNKVKA